MELQSACVLFCIHEYFTLHITREKARKYAKLGRIVNKDFYNAIMFQAAVQSQESFICTLYLPQDRMKETRFLAQV